MAGVIEFIKNNKYFLLLMALMIMTALIFRQAIVEGDSMNNTLQDGDRLVISKLFYTPERGDIIVFEDHSTGFKKPLVKRVIGLPGDTVEVKISPNGEYEVYINGEFLEEEYAYNDVQDKPDKTGVWTVEDGELFVLGDNRYNSTDSRQSGFGTISRDSIIGKVLVRIYPFNKFGRVN